MWTFILVMYILSIFGTWFSMMLLLTNGRYYQLVKRVRITIMREYDTTMESASKITNGKALRFKVWAYITCLIPVFNVIMVYTIGSGIKNGVLERNIKDMF